MFEKLKYGITKTNKGTYYKFTGYHANGKQLEEMTPEGYKCTKIASKYNNIKKTNIYIMLLELKNDNKLLALKGA